MLHYTNLIGRFSPERSKSEPFLFLKSPVTTCKRGSGWIPPEFLQTYTNLEEKKRQVKGGGALLFHYSFNFVSEKP